MRLQISPDAPPLVQVAAAGLLFLHIGGAGVGLLTGGAAMAAPKGGRLHRAAGNVFFIAMLAMAAVGAAVAPFLPAEQVPNTTAGVFTFYLVATAWATVRRRPGESGRFEVSAAFMAVAVAAGAVAFGLESALSGHPLPAPEGPVLYVFAAVAALAAACDFAMIRRGGISGAPRLARHLWRMSTALLIAAGSFAGQPRAIPEFLRGSPLLLLPVLATLVLMIFWLARVRLAKRSWKPTARAAESISPRLSRAA